jgi:hypothetical protein
MSYVCAVLCVSVYDCGLHYVTSCAMRCVVCSVVCCVALRCVLRCVACCVACCVLLRVALHVACCVLHVACGVLRAVFLYVPAPFSLVLSSAHRHDTGRTKSVHAVQSSGRTISLLFTIASATVLPAGCGTTTATATTTAELLKAERAGECVLDSTHIHTHLRLRVQFRIRALFCSSSIYRYQRLLKTLLGWHR